MTEGQLGSVDLLLAGAEVRHFSMAPAAIELGAVRARRHELDLAISQQERALEEALRVLSRGDGEAASAGAAHTG